MGFPFYQLISEFEMLASKVINVESVFIVILIMAIVNESILFDFINRGLFSFIVLFAIIFIYSQSVITKTLYLFLPLFLFLFLSVTINANKTSIGGFNTFLAFISSLPFLFVRIRRKGVNVFYMYKALVVLSILFLILVYYYYYFGLQQTPDHLSFVLAGPYSNQNTLAMILYSFIALLTFFHPKSTNGIFRNKFFALLIFSFYISIFLTQSRAGILSSTILLLYFYRKNLIFVAPLFISFLFILPSSFFNRDFIERAFDKILESSSSGRVDFWYNTIYGLTNNIITFLFGVGVNNTRIETDDGAISVHSSYVNFIANYGFLATLIMFFILIYIMYRSYKISFILFLIMFSTLLYGAFETILFSGYSIAWLTMLFIYYSGNSMRDCDAYTNYSFRTSGH